MTALSISGAVLKLFALIFMTTDHIGAYIPHMPMWLRYIGRLALPLFFFCAAESMAHTRDRFAYLKRLYIASVTMAALEFAVPQLLKMFAGLDIGTVDNAAFLTIFQGALIIYLIEETKGDKKNRAKYLFAWLMWQTGTVILDTVIYPSVMNNAAARSVMHLAFTALGSVMAMEGSLLIVLMIPLFYFFRDSKKKLAAAYLIYCGVYFVLFVFALPVRLFTFLYNSGLPYGFVSVAEFAANITGLRTHLPAGINGFPQSVFSEYQWMMVFALPFMLLYNGEKGRGPKRLFYIYYPVHIFILRIAGALINMK